MYKVVAIMGKSASGKTTLQKAIAREFDVNEIVSTTTRPKRDREKEGVDYKFVTIEQFTEKVLNGDMLEADDFNDWFYGTEISALNENKVNVGVFTPNGVEALAQDGRIDLKVIYIDADDKQRLLRSLNRETNPDVAEICRRYFADEKDFCDDRMGELADMNLNVMTITSNGSKSIYQIASEVAPFIFGRD